MRHCRGVRERQAASRWGPSCLVVPKKGLHWGSLKCFRRTRLSVPCVSPLLSGILLVYSCSKRGEDLFPSQEYIYSTFSFSNPAALWLFVYLFILGSVFPTTRRTITPNWGRTRAAMPVYPPDRDPLITLVALGWPLTPCFPSHCPEALEPWEGAGCR